MKYFSMFSGIGGFELGIHRAIERIKINRKIKSEIDIPMFEGRSEEGGFRADCVGFSEIDKHAIQIYQKNFPSHKGYGDATRINATDIPEFDFLVGGFPCQAFSIAGQRRGFDDTRGTLFFEIARILKERRPCTFLLENVKGLLSHDKGRTYKTIISTLAELGYGIEWQVLNSKDFGVPQNRERVFIVGHLGGECTRKIFPIRCGNAEDQGQNTSNAIDANYWKGIDNHGQRTHIGTLRTFKDGEGFRKLKSGISPSLQCRAREDGSGQPVISIQDTRDINKKQNGCGFKDGNESYTVDTLATQGIFDGCRIRRLTPVECERLQGFPDGWTEGVSDTQRYKCLGNSVTVNVVEQIIMRIIGVPS